MKSEIAYRSAEIVMQPTEGKPEESRPYMSISSAAPVPVRMMFKGKETDCLEMLDHGPASVDMTRAKDGLVVRDGHTGDQVGLMTVENKDGKLGGYVEFCTGERAQEIAADVAKGLRRNVSVGYARNAVKMEGEKDGIPLVRTVAWTLIHAAFVPDPADPSVGVGRSETVTKIETKEISMDPKDITQINKIARQFNVPADVVDAHIEAGKSLDEFRSIALDIAGRALVAKPTPAAAPVIPLIGGTPEAQAKVVREYSLVNVLRALGGGKVDIGYEREVSEDCAKRQGKAAQGIIIPHAVLAKRDFTVLGTSSATVATNLVAGEFIDLLRSASILAGLGVRFISGLVGDIAIPKMTGAAGGYWVAESGDITESAPTLGQVTGTPHTCGVLVDISRKLLMQSTPAAEMLIRDEIIQRLARTVQLAVFAGTGADGQPLAITGAAGINNPSVTQGTPTYAELLNFPGSIMADNATADGMKWAMTGEVWAKLAATATNGAGSPLALDPISGKLCGFPYLVSEDVGANSLFFGNWAAVMVGIWGMGIDINADTATLSAQGGLRLVGLQDVDVMVRNGQSLAYNAAVTA